MIATTEMSTLVYLLLTGFVCTVVSFGGVVDWNDKLWKPVDDPKTLGDLLNDRHRRDVKQVPECKDGYEKVEGNTMCKPDSSEYIEGSAGVSDADRKLILETHNDFRSVVEPGAKQMMKLYWDDELAKTAEKWAKQCTIGHNQANERYIPKYKSVPGQNGGYHLGSWENVLKTWFTESKEFIFGLKPDKYTKRGEKDIGHYSMMVVDKSHLIGCGYARCEAPAVEFYFCHYLAGPKNVAFPYKPGLACTTCPNNCSNDLCDCGHRYCFNSGILNLEKCQCECIHPWKGERCLVDACNGTRCKNGGKFKPGTCVCDCLYPYSGDLCEEKRCKLRQDPVKCKRHDVNYCSVPSKKLECPVLCDICPDICPGLKCINGRKDPTSCQCVYPCPGKVCKNEGKLRLDTCDCECSYPYTGADCGQIKCTGKPDDSFCKVYWPPFMCYVKQIKMKCPVLCRKCSGACAAFRCQNYGKKRTDCTCSCNYPFSGPRCLKKQCLKKLDPWDCGNRWPKQYCKRFSNIRVFCPIMCGTCPDFCGGKRCRNTGVLNVEKCTCTCPVKYKGEKCEKLACVGRECKNDGTLDYKTCKCLCHRNYSGRMCEKLTCPRADPEACTRKGYQKYHCFTQKNVLYMCPNLCGSCSK